MTIGAGEAVRAEMTKLSSLRSTTWTLLATVVSTLLVTVLVTNGIHRSGRPAWQGFDPTNESLSGLAIGQLTIGLLGILMITGEYGSGTIRSSLAAVLGVACFSEPKSSSSPVSPSSSVRSWPSPASSRDGSSSRAAPRWRPSDNPECYVHSSCRGHFWHSWVCSVWASA